jgi:beta-N-acetylhexosaminidase
MHDKAIDRRLMLSFLGPTLPDDVRTTLERHDVSGVTLFRPNNYRDVEQLRTLTESLQESRSASLPLLIAIDQEGGQLHAFGSPATVWIGNMALGAADDERLTERVGYALGRELRAVGINVNYAPVADLASNPMNPATGARAFGDDPNHVARHVVAIIKGLQSAGVAATMKHFPGKGDSEVDSHHAMPIIRHDRGWLDRHEFVPFKAAIAAGVKLAMTGHFALPSITGSDDLPCTLAAETNTDLLRNEMGFDGPLITDALDMKALSQGSAQAIDVIAAVRSGVDLLLMTADAEQEQRVTSALSLAMSRRLIDPNVLTASDDRVSALRTWVGEFDTPDLAEVGSEAHQRLNREVAQRSITLVKDDTNLVPIDTTSSVVVVIEPETFTVTPADTSDLESPTLATYLSTLVGGRCESMVYSRRPAEEEIEAAATMAASADIVVVATAAATIEELQAELVRKVVEANERTIVVAQRTPFDLALYPQVPAYLCAWSVNPVSMEAAAKAIVGAAPISGALPVPVVGFGRGHGLARN